MSYISRAKRSCTELWNEREGWQVKAVSRLMDVAFCGKRGLPLWHPESDTPLGWWFRLLALRLRTSFSFYECAFTCWIWAIFCAERAGRKICKLLPLVIVIVGGGAALGPGSRRLFCVTWIALATAY